jgi:hypothetical protein
MSDLYELRIVASGEVRDKDGNLVEQVPVEQTVTLTEEQVRELFRDGEQE